MITGRKKSFGGKRNHGTGSAKGVILSLDLDGVCERGSFSVYLRYAQDATPCQYQEGMRMELVRCIRGRKPGRVKWRMR